MARGDAEGRYDPTAEQEELRQQAFKRALSHSRKVKWLKLSLPLIVVAVIVGWGLIAVFNPFRQVPKGVSASGYSLDGTRITMEQPRLSGYHKNGQPYHLRATTAQQDLRSQNIIDLSEMQGSMGMDDGKLTHVSALTATYDSNKQTMVMRTNVEISSDTAYTLRMNTAFINFNTGSLTANEPVTMTLKNGNVLADSLMIVDNGRLVSFNGHVKSMFSTERTSPPEGPAQ
eukprot:gene9448-9528_t